MVLLLAFGLAVLFSTSGVAFREQVVFTAFGIFLYFGISFVDFRLLKVFSAHLYFLLILLLLITLFFGIYSKGAIRWIPLGIEGFTLQPSEFMKLGLIVFLSAFLSGRFGNLTFRDFGLSLLMALLPSSLVYFQPDLGTAAVIILIWFSLSVMARFKFAYFITLFFVIMLFLPLMFFSLKPYQRERLRTYVVPSLDPLGRGYHVLQSEIAVGSGKIFGRGFGRGTQSHLRFLPEYQTDFVFASLSEEWGFLGSAIVLVLFGIIFFRLISVSSGSPFLFGQFLGLGIFSMLFSQMLINIGMNLGVVPITGIPLPLLSSGGSSLILTLISLGIVQSVARTGKRV